MKQSRYNLILYFNGYGYWYNAMTGSHFRLSESLSSKIENIGDQITQLEPLIPDIYKQLSEQGFIIPADTDELELVREKHHAEVQAKDYMLVVLPTLNCNFKCWYCIQDHIPSLMNDVTLVSILKHIDYMVDEEQISSLHLEWFGGEPLMFFEKIIQPISKHALKKCTEKDIPFSNSATTNGYFLNAVVISKLEELKFRNFQITLDGDKQFHDEVKFMNGCDSAFEHVLTNINNMLSDTKNTTVCLRINYTHKTLSEKIVDEVSRFIGFDNRCRITVTPRKVWQESVDKAFTLVLTGILDKFSDAGFRVSRGDVYPTFTPCYVNKKYYNAINFNGNVVKCTACNDLYENENPKGRLLNDGTIQWRDEYDLKCQEATFENERCLNCKKLPLCMGLCPRDHMAGYNKCKYDTVDSDIEKNLLNFLIREYNA